MKKVAAFFFALVLLMPIFAACGSKANRPEHLIAGRWEPEGPTRFQSMDFIPDSGSPQRGRVDLRMMGNDISGEYEITPGDEQHKLTINYTLALLPATREFTFTIESDTLVLQEENSSASVNYRKVVAG